MDPGFSVGKRSCGDFIQGGSAAPVGVLLTLGGNLWP